MKLAKYFPDLTQTQEEQFRSLVPLYFDWNSKINTISRKDIDQIETHHILHSLAIARVIEFRPGTRILDAGTGGGFPGIPLAILFPEAHFTLADSTGKKIKVVQAVAEVIGLSNVTPLHARVEDLDEKFDFVTGRAVSAIDKFINWIRDKVLPDSFNTLPNGLLYLKGGEIGEEMSAIREPVRIFNIADFFDEPYFVTKKLIHVALP